MPNQESMRNTQISISWQVGIGATFTLGVLGVALIAQLGFMRAANDQQTCFSNLRRMGQDFAMYAADYDGGWPPQSVWEHQPTQITRASGCPAARPMPGLPGLKALGVPGYAYNSLLSPRYDLMGHNPRPVAAASIPFPQTTVAVCEEAVGIPITTQVDPYAGMPMHPTALEEGWKRHHGGGQYLFCDGHVTWLAASAVEDYDDLVTAGNRGVKPTFAVAPPEVTRR